MIHDAKIIQVAIQARAWRSDWFSVEPAPGRTWEVNLFYNQARQDFFRLPADRPVVIRFIDDKGTEVKRIDLDPQNKPDPQLAPKGV